MTLAQAGIGWHAVMYAEEARIHRRNDRCSPLDAGRREKARETPPASDGGSETSGTAEGPEITFAIFSLVTTYIRGACEMEPL
jgi:hypothetical protein